MTNIISVAVIMIIVPIILEIIKSRNAIKADISYRGYGTVLLICALLSELLIIIISFLPGTFSNMTQQLTATIIWSAVNLIIAILGLLVYNYTIEIRHNKIVVTGYTKQVREYLYTDIFKVEEDENKNIIVYFNDDKKLLFEKIFPQAQLHLKEYLDKYNIKIEYKYNYKEFIIEHKTEETIAWVFFVLVTLLGIIVSILGEDSIIIMIIWFLGFSLPCLVWALYNRYNKIEFNDGAIISYKLLRRPRIYKTKEIDYIKRYMSNQAVTYNIHFKNKSKLKILVSEAYKGSYYFEELLKRKNWKLIE